MKRNPCQDRCRGRRFQGVFALCVVVLLTAACVSTPKTERKPAFRVVETTLAKAVDDVGGQDLPLHPTTRFTTQDPAVIAHVSLADLSGTHRIHWKWYDPDGRLYLKSPEHVLGTPPDKYAATAAAWHKISLKGERAARLPGGWHVQIYLDEKLVTTRHFNIDIESPGISADAGFHIPQTAMQNPDGVAVVIGNRRYRHPDIPVVEYAHRDAEAVKQYLVQTLGYRENNIFLEKDISKARFEALFGISGNHRGIVHDYVKPGRSDVFVYYSGHGAPDLEKMKGYFLPVDCDPAKIALNGYALDVFYINLAHMAARRITVVLDCCFSGGSSRGEHLVDSASPALIKVDTAPILQADAAVLTSAGSDQISSWYDEKGHGLFTYFFLQGSGGPADADRDGRITFEEMHRYLSDRSEGVPYWARRLHGGRTQTPMLYGNRDNDVLVQLY